MVWGNVARPCPSEESFHRGESNVGCATMCSVARWTYKIAGLRCKSCTAKKAKTDVQLGEVKSLIKELRGRVEVILSKGKRQVGEEVGDKNVAGGKALQQEEVDLLREAGVEFDDEYEARLAEALLEEFSPVSSPVGSEFSEEVGTEGTDVSDVLEDREQLGVRVVGDDDRHRLLLLPAIVRANCRKSTRD